jgi:hypothetical protein
VADAISRLDGWSSELCHRDQLCEPCDLIVHYGYSETSRQLAYARANGIPQLILDLGYFGDRRATPSLGFNSINGLAIRPEPLEAARPKPVLKPWNHKIPPETIMVCGQMPNDSNLLLGGIEDTNQWAADNIVELEKRYPDAEIIYRPHPYEPQIDNPKPIEEDLKDVDLVVTFSSNAGVDAIINGVPATADSRISMISGIDGRSTWNWNVSGIDYPDVRDDVREQWAHWLSYCQWSYDELQDGVKWVMESYDEAVIQSAVRQERASKGS